MLTMSVNPSSYICSVRSAKLLLRSEQRPNEKTPGKST